MLQHCHFALLFPSPYEQKLWQSSSCALPRFFGTVWAWVCFFSTSLLFFSSSPLRLVSM